MFMTCLIDIIVDPYWIYSLLVLGEPVLGLFTSAAVLEKDNTSTITGNCVYIEDPYQKHII
jgi:hypothetical protein